MLSIAPREIISTPKVRLAVADDVPQLLKLAYDLHSENGILDLDIEMVKDVVMRAIDRNGAILGLIGGIGAIEGMIYLAVGKYWYSSLPHLEELFSYVRPEFRRSTNAKTLIEFAKKQADECGVPLLIGIVSTTDTERKIEMYKRCLGPVAGAYFLYGAKTGSN